MKPYTPNLSDPRSRGWGGRTYQRWLDESPFLNAAIYTVILMAFSAMYSDELGPAFIAWGWFWLSPALLIVLYTIYRDTNRYRIAASKPCVSCDPHGLTIRNYFGRIRQQWYWCELAQVSGQGVRLTITPQHGQPCTYRDSRLNYADYADIAAVASGYLHEQAPPVPPPPAHIERKWHTPSLNIWNALLAILAFLAFAWFFVFLAIQAVAIYRAYPDPPIVFGLTTLLVVAILGYGAWSLLRLILRIHHAICRGESSLICAHADRDGLHLARLSGATLHLAWQDIRSSHHEHDVIPDRHFPKERDFLLIADRCGNTLKVNIDYCKDSYWDGEDIAAVTHAIIHGTPLPDECEYPTTGKSAPLAYKVAFYSIVTANLACIIHLLTI